MPTPYLTIALDRIEHNARSVVALCRKHGIAVTGVTKGACGHPDVAKAMLRGGVASIADSRLRNLKLLQDAGVDTDMLLRVPALSAVDQVVATVDCSLNSELAVLAGLSTAAERLDKKHNVIVMVDLGDLREGVWPDDLVPFVRQAVRLPGIRVTGLGTNLACFAGVVPSEAQMIQLAKLADEVERTCGIVLERVSGINSSGLALIATGHMPRRINHARIGEAILLGRETVHGRPWPETFQDTFVLHAEVLEKKLKPSLPIGPRTRDAFGRLPDFEDRGDRLRALLNVGREDVDIEGLTPLDLGVSILGASSGYLVVDVTDAKKAVEVGDELAFSLNYAALLAAMTSEYVHKRPVMGRDPNGPP